MVNRNNKFSARDFLIRCFLGSCLTAGAVVAQTSTDSTQNSRNNPPVVYAADRQNDLLRQNPPPIIDLSERYKPAVETVLDALREFVFERALWSYEAFGRTAQGVNLLFGSELLRLGSTPETGRSSTYEAYRALSMRIEPFHFEMESELQLNSGTWSPDRGLASMRQSLRRDSLSIWTTGDLSATYRARWDQPGISAAWTAPYNLRAMKDFPLEAEYKAVGPIELALEPGEVQIRQATRKNFWLPSQQVLRDSEVGSRIFGRAIGLLSGSVGIAGDVLEFRNRVDYFSRATQIISPDPFLRETEKDPIERVVRLEGSFLSPWRSSYSMSGAKTGFQQTSFGGRVFHAREIADGPLFGPGRVSLFERTHDVNPFGSRDTFYRQYIHTTNAVEAYGFIFFPARTYDPSDTILSSVSNSQSYREVRTRQGIARTPVPKQVAPLPAKEAAFLSAGGAQLNLSGARGAAGSPAIPEMHPSSRTNPNVGGVYMDIPIDASAIQDGRRKQ